MTAGLRRVSRSRASSTGQQTGLPRYYVIFLFIILGGAIGYVLGGIIGREITAAGVGSRPARQPLARRPDARHRRAPRRPGLALIASSPFRLVKPAWLGHRGSTVLLMSSSRTSACASRCPSGVSSRHVPAPRAGRARPPADELKLLDTSAVIDDGSPSCSGSASCRARCACPASCSPSCRRWPTPLTTRAGPAGAGVSTCSPRSAAEDAVPVFETDYPEIPQVDEKLVRLASTRGATLVTVDYNLTRSPASGARGDQPQRGGGGTPAELPAGRDHPHSGLKRARKPSQGVGYLEDGTMVVVRRPRRRQRDRLEVTSVLQTSAGRMIFARPSHAADGGGRRERARRPSCRRRERASGSGSPVASSSRTSPASRSCVDVGRSTPPRDRPDRRRCPADRVEEYRAAAVVPSSATPVTSRRRSDTAGVRRGGPRGVARSMPRSCRARWRASARDRRRSSRPRSRARSRPRRGWRGRRPPAYDTLKIVDGAPGQTPDRAQLLGRADAAGVPRRGARDAYRPGGRRRVRGTDDASLVEHAGGRVVACRGPAREHQGHGAEDLALVEATLAFCASEEE